MIYRISDLGTFKIPLIYFIKKTKNIFIFIRNTNNTNYPLFQGHCEQSICMVGQSMSCQGLGQSVGRVWAECGQGNWCQLCGHSWLSVSTILNSCLLSITIYFYQFKHLYYRRQWYSRSYKEAINSQEPSKFLMIRLYNTDKITIYFTTDVLANTASPCQHS